MLKQVKYRVDGNHRPVGKEPECDIEFRFRFGIFCAIFVFQVFFDNVVLHRDIIRITAKCWINPQLLNFIPFALGKLFEPAQFTVTNQGIA